MAVILAFIVGWMWWRATAPERLHAAYRAFTTVDVPATITNFDGSAFVGLPIFMDSYGHFTYTATPEYFVWLTQRSEEVNQYLPNESILHNVPCDAPLRWGLNRIVRNNGALSSEKQCLTGRFIAFAHYIITDPKTGFTEHFVVDLKS